MIPKSISYNTLKHLILTRNKDVHKGSFGHVLVVGGDHGLGGAAIMASEAAARTGAGLVSIATHLEHIPSILARRPELMPQSVESAEELAQAISRATVIVIGPGLGKSEWSRLCLKSVLNAQTKNNTPLVVDADALNLLSEGGYQEFISHSNNWILTPHVGEAARLLSCSREVVLADRLEAVTRLHAQYGGTCLLKGAGTLLAYTQQGRIIIEKCDNGNPGMATGGMGDILSGILGGLLAQQFPLHNSARIGVCLHGESADKVAAANGQRGMLATDILPYIQQLMNP